MSTDSVGVQKSNTDTKFPSGSKHIASDEISLKDLFLEIGKAFKYLYSKKYIILFVVLLGCVCGFFYAKSKKIKYIATTTFYLEGAGGGGGSLLGQYAGLAAMAGISVGGSGDGMFQGDNLFELYKSRTMIEKALLKEVIVGNRKYKLIDRYISINKLKQGWKGTKLENLSFDLEKRMSFNRLQDSVLKGIVDDINGNYLNVDKPNKQVSIIRVQVTANNEEFAKDFNEQIVNTVNDFYSQTKTKNSLQNLAILQHQTDSVKRMLNSALYQTVAISDATPNLNPNRQLLRAPAQRSQFNAEANKMILSQLVQNLEVAKITLRKETPLLQVIDQPLYPLELKKVSAVKWAILGGIAFGVLSAVGILIVRFVKNVTND
ncbi:lipopolysaccharide biosynthesis protein [Mucilaginibacter sp. CSA2-8R]|uniref:lipopolysaccharide biosynthesis protein n=1 Tax=Mucilaginibacter sp. CSA2-8R TaxID=3141542 RepID=UPI00315D1AF4